MKKFVSIILVAVMLFAMAGCAGSKNGTEAGSVKNEEKEDVISDGKVSAILESCRFADQIHGIDGEYVAGYIPAGDTKVFVDVVFYIKENSRAVTEEDFSGYIMYENERYDLQFATEYYNCVGVETLENYPADQVGRIHLFSQIPEAAMDEAVEVNLTALTEEMTVLVEAMDTSEPLSRKTEVNVGDEIVTESGVVIKIKKCEVTEYIYASDTKNSLEYRLFGTGDVIDLVIDITNGSDYPFNGAWVYSINEDGVVKGECKVETNNNTEISDIDSDGIPSGKSEIIHLIAESNGDDNIIRFNIDGVCYYCKG